MRSIRGEIGDVGKGRYMREKKMAGEENELLYDCLPLFRPSRLHTESSVSDFNISLDLVADRHPATDL